MNEYEKGLPNFLIASNLKKNLSTDLESERKSPPSDLESEIKTPPTDLESEIKTPQMNKYEKGLPNFLLALNLKKNLSTDLESERKRPPSDLESEIKTPPTDLESEIKTPQMNKYEKGLPNFLIASNLKKNLSTDLESERKSPPFDLESEIKRPPSDLESEIKTPPTELESEIKTPPIDLASVEEKFRNSTTNQTQKTPPTELASVEEKFRNSTTNQTQKTPPTELASVEVKFDLSHLTIQQLKHPKNREEAIAFAIETTKREIAIAQIPEARYTKENTNCVNNLYYSWDGWLSNKVPVPKNAESAIKSQIENWEKDGFILKQWRVKNDMIQILFKVSPEISPVLFTQRVKGRLDYAFRQLKTPIKFSRKVGFRSLGDNTRKIVNNYITNQVKNSDYVDIKFKEYLENYTLFNAYNDLSEPYIKTHGRYWNNIHLVIVVESRDVPIAKDETMNKIKKHLFKIAKKHKTNIAYYAIMPDHIHISLKVNPELSPYNIGLSFINNLDYLLKINCKVWNKEFYIGSFSEYNINLKG